MKYRFVFFVISAAITGPVFAASLLRGDTSFPATFAELPFTTRMEIERAGYEDWEPEYDASGRCVRGCAYHGMRIEDDLEMMRRQTENAISAATAAGVQFLPTTIPAPATITPTHVPVAPSMPQLPSGGTASTSGVPLTNVGAACNPNNPDIKPGQKYPIGEPVIGRPRISSPFGDRIHPVTKIRTPHRGVDLAVPTGTNVFSPADGTVASVWTDDTCGRGIRISHTDGFETVYCHLSQQLVSIGDTVSAGCQIGNSGNTGRSTGPHLHYGIKQNGTYINPNKFMGRG